MFRFYEKKKETISQLSGLSGAHTHTQNLKRAAAAGAALCVRHFAIEDRFTWTRQTEGEL